MGLELLLPLMIIALIVMMFLQSSKQRKALKAVQQMQDSLVVGDRVLTTSGVHAQVVAVNEDTIDLEISPGVRTRWDRRVIRERINPASTSGTEAGTDSGTDSGTDASGSQ